MKLHRCGEIALFVSLVVTSVLLAGCVICQSDVKYTSEGRPVGDKTLRKIECGETTKDWLVAALGEPSEKSMTQDGIEILRYRCTMKRDNSFVLFPFVIIDDDREIERSVSFEIKDGIVQRYWKEG